MAIFLRRIEYIVYTYVYTDIDIYIYIYIYICMYVCMYVYVLARCIHTQTCRARIVRVPWLVLRLK